VVYGEKLWISGDFLWMVCGFSKVFLYMKQE
jgi:hypothetical protein